MGAEFGRPQQGYNPSVHGPYHPGRWYGKGEIRFWEATGITSINPGVEVSQSAAVSTN